MITKDLGRLQYLAGIINEEMDFIPSVQLTEQEESIFEGYWNQYITEGDGGIAKREVEKVLNDKYKAPKAVENLSNGFFDAVKHVVKSIWGGIKGAPEFVFANINKMVWWIISTILFKPMQALMIAIGGAAVTLYQVLIDVLNIKTDPTKIFGMEIPGIEYAAGDKVDSAFMGSLESGWDNFIDFIQSYEPTSIAEAPIEVITEILAAGLEAIGLAVPAIIEGTKMVGAWLLSIGLSNVAVIIAWLYLIGGTVWLFKKAKPHIVDPMTNFVKRQLPQFKKEMSEPAKDIERSASIG